MTVESMKMAWKFFAYFVSKAWEKHSFYVYVCVFNYPTITYVYTYLFIHLFIFYVDMI